MHPSMSDEGLAAAAEHSHPINESCTSLTPVHSSEETGSALTIWCQMGDQSKIRWLGSMEMKDLGFLLPG